MSAQAPARSEIEVGNEILNAWAWLLNRAPRVARAIDQTPGTGRTFADIMAGFDLFHRRYGITEKREYAEVQRQVTYDEPTDIIVVRQAWREPIKYE